MIWTNMSINMSSSICVAKGFLKLTKVPLKSMLHSLKLSKPYIFVAIPLPKVKLCRGSFFLKNFQQKQREDMEHGVEYASFFRRTGCHDWPRKGSIQGDIHIIICQLFWKYLVIAVGSSITRTICRHNPLDEQ